MKQKRQYGPVAINYFWCDPCFRAQKGIPINEHGVEMLKKNTWWKSSSQTMPDVWKEECCLRIAALPGEDPVARRGQLRVISPDEIRDSFLLVLADRIANGARAEELAKWRKLVLTTPAIFEPVENESGIFLRFADLREHATTVLSAVKRTPLGRIMEVLRFKQQMEKDISTGKTKSITWESVPLLVNAAIRSRAILLSSKHPPLPPPNTNAES